MQIDILKLWQKTDKNLSNLESAATDIYACD